jgi:hypothetical protein
MVKNKLQNDRKRRLSPEVHVIKIEDDDEKTTKNMNFEKERLDVIKVEHTRYFASGSYMNVIGDAHGVSKMSVSRSIHSIAKKHCQKHWSIYIQYPMTSFPYQVDSYEQFEYQSCNRVD